MNFTKFQEILKYVNNNYYMNVHEQTDMVEDMRVQAEERKEEERVQKFGIMKKTKN